MKKIFSTFLVSLVFLSLFLFSFFKDVYSIEKVDPVNLNTIQQNMGNSSLPTNISGLISKIIPYIFTIAGILLLIFFIASGFQFIFAAGDPKKMESAKAHITTALIGFIIIFVSYWLVQILGRIFNIPSIISIFQ
jgi:uncharacterized membrane protein